MRISLWFSWGINSSKTIIWTKEISFLSSFLWPKCRRRRLQNLRKCNRKPKMFRKSEQGKTQTNGLVFWRRNTFKTLSFYFSIKNMKWITAYQKFAKRRLLCIVQTVHYKKIFSLYRLKIFFQSSERYSSAQLHTRQKNEINLR